MKQCALIVFISVGILFGGCERGDDIIDKKPLCDSPNANQRIAGTWKVIKLEIKGKLTDSVSVHISGFYAGPWQPTNKITIAISDTIIGRICGYTLLHNYVWAEYKSKIRQRINFTNFKRTIAYADDRDAVSLAFEQNLQNTVSYCFSNSNLVLLNDDNRPVILLERVSNEPDMCTPQNICDPQDITNSSSCNDGVTILNNRWKVLKQNISGELICVSAIPHYSVYYFSSPSISFPDLLEGTISGSTGLNMMIAKYQIDGQQIIFNTVDNITRGGEYGWGTAFHQNLRETKTYHCSNDYLFFFNEFDQPTVVFIKD